MSQKEEEAASVRRKASEKSARWRARQSQETLNRIRDAKRAAYHRHRNNAMLTLTPSCRVIDADTNQHFPDNERITHLCPYVNKETNQHRFHQETLNETNSHRDAGADSHQRIRENKSSEETLLPRDVHDLTHQYQKHQTLDEATVELTQSRLYEDANIVRGRMSQNEEAVVRKRHKAAERTARWKARQSQDSLDRIRLSSTTAYRRRCDHETKEQTLARRAVDAEKHQHRREQETFEETESRRALDAKRYKRRRDQDTLEETTSRRDADANTHRRIRENETFDQTQLRRHADAERHQNRRDQETLEQTELRRSADARTHRQILDRETVVQTQLRRDVDAKRHQNSRDQETLEETELRRNADAHTHRRIRENETAVQTQSRQDADAQRHRSLRDQETLEETELRRNADAHTHRQIRENQSVVQTQSRRDTDAKRHQNIRDQETFEETELRRDADKSTHRRIRENETLEQTQSRRAVDAETHRIVRNRHSQAIRDEAINFVEGNILEHYCGPMDAICRFCLSKNFISECPSDGKFTHCCQKGKIKLEAKADIHGSVLSYPDFLKNLLMDPTNPDYKNFRENIRSYNSAVSFASMGAKIVDFHNRGPYVFKIHGQTFHRTSHIHPVSGRAPQYAQLYVIDSTQAVEIRTGHAANANCFPRILDLIDRFFRQHNRLSDAYRMLREVEARALEDANQIGRSLPVVNMVFRRDRHSDQRRYNAPTSNEVAMVFVNSDGEPPFERDIRVYPLNPLDPQQPFININILSPNLDPMTYPILFPYGEPGWQPNWRSEAYDGAQPNRSRVNISMLQYKSALTAIREDFNPIISAGKLTQQWIVDSYLQVEANNLNYIRTHQQQLRTEVYQGLADHMENAAGNATGALPGLRLILPSSFEGSPRNMRERCADAMAIFSKYGAPDLFITFTANPKWTEITINLRPGEQPSDRPDLVARVFQIKLKSLMEDLTVHCVLGKSIAHVYTIEFRKRGLPHAHILIVLRVEDKFNSPERIDQFICAEIPSETQNQRLYAIVTKCMIHGPCGINNPGAPCMENGKCKKMFPKPYQQETLQNTDGYPLYRRRSDTAIVMRGNVIDNRYVVPYNPFLTLKYNAHINVEVSTSIRAVKYIYKYIYKGYDSANMVITAGQNNEVQNYIDARYVSAPEAMWRLLESKMHDRSHTVVRLPVHLPNHQRIIFQEGHEEEALEAARSGITKLESWFQLNQMDPLARVFLYTEIPYNYVYTHKKWQHRLRGGKKVVTRMYLVSVRDEERFYLRMLLLHVPGATSFQFLRTVDNVIYDTFKQAAFQRNLLSSDEEWDRSLHDAATFQMPRQLRMTFSYILCFCNPTTPFDLWNKYVIDMCLDYLRSNTEEIAKNLALHDINSVLKQHGLSCAMVGLPVPTGNAIQVQPYNQIEEREEAQRLIATLNSEQHAAFMSITKAITNINECHRYFYLDGPGGSGKTYLYTTILAFIRGRGEIALPFATTGIAATLLKGGRTVHSGFKLPVPLLETSVSSMRLTSQDAEQLRQCILIIIDEVTMLTKHGLRCIDLLLREIMSNDNPFGGKVVIIGGDFRQTLPVVPHGSRTDVIESCIKSSPLWSIFISITLTTNMRSAGQNQHNSWLLNIGSGNTPTIPSVPIGSIVVPQKMIVENNLVTAIYSEQLGTMQVQELAKRVILAPTNKQTLEINREIIQKIQGVSHIYYSSDSIVSEDPNDFNNYPPEFLHQQTPSGMPPHVLLLKKGVMVMLIRNLNPKQGLCNGTRLTIEGLHSNLISAKIVSGCNSGEIVFLPRLDLAPSDISLPFILKRRQFPVIPAYAMTINKSQGQTFEHVGIYLDKPVFSHGQLYVALSRSRNSEHVKVFMNESELQGKFNDSNYFTQNVVFHEVFL